MVLPNEMGADALLRIPHYYMGGYVLFCTVFLTALKTKIWFLFIAPFDL